MFVFGGLLPLGQVIIEVLTRLKGDRALVARRILVCGKEKSIGLGQGARLADS
jgi:hypothetical protein